MSDFRSEPLELIYLASNYGAFELDKQARDNEFGDPS